MTDGCACALPWKVCCLHYGDLTKVEKDRARTGARVRGDRLVAGTRLVHQTESKDRRRRAQG